LIVETQRSSRQPSRNTSPRPSGPIDRVGALAPSLFGPACRTRSRTSIALPFFFRPARKPRTVCGAHPVASMMAGPLAPSVRPSRASTCCCFVHSRGLRGPPPLPRAGARALPDPNREPHPTIPLFAIIGHLFAFHKSEAVAQISLKYDAVKKRESKRQCKTANPNQKSPPYYG
jgi:hypothetical protein